MSSSVLGVAGTNTFRPSKMIRFSCATDQFNEKKQHLILKRRSDPHGTRGNQTYKTDSDLMTRLNTWAQEHGYPAPEGYVKGRDGGYIAGTNRAPIVLMSNDPSKIFQISRQMWRSHAILCECSEWVLKDRSQCKADELPYPCEDLDDERYYIGTATAHKYRQETKTNQKSGASWQVNIKTGTEQRVCNPLKCPFAKSAGPGQGAQCKPITEIQLMLGAWGGSEPAIVHATSWSTARRLPSSLALVMREVQAIAGVTIDLVLDRTEPLRNPDGIMVRQPFWAFGLPWGMTPEEFRARAIRDAELLIADNRRLMELAAMQNAMMELAGTDYHRGALLPEFRPDQCLPPAPEPETGPLSVAEKQAVEDLTHGHGFSPEVADALVRANAEDIEGMYGRLGTEAERASEEPPALEGEWLPDDDQPSEPDQPETLFETEPTTLKAIAQRFEALGEVEVGKSILQTTRGKLREEMGEAATGEALVLAYLAAAEEWWAREGRAIHGAGELV